MLDLPRRKMDFPEAPAKEFFLIRSFELSQMPCRCLLAIITLAFCHATLASEYTPLTKVELNQLEIELNATTAEKRFKTGHRLAQQASSKVVCSAGTKKLAFQLSKGMTSVREVVKKLSLQRAENRDSQKTERKLPELLHEFSICWARIEQKKGANAKELFEKARTLYSEPVILEQSITKPKLTPLLKKLEKSERPPLSVKKKVIIGSAFAGAALLGASGYRHRYLLDETYRLFAGSVEGSMRSFKRRFGVYRANLRKYRETTEHLNPVAKNVGMCCPSTKGFAETSPRVVNRLFKFQRWMDGPDAPFSTLAVILASTAMWTIALDTATDEEQKKNTAMFMGLTMGTLGLVKLLNVTGTASRLSKYDLLIQSSSSSGLRSLATSGFSYSLMYPYIEALIGISYLSGINDTAAHVATIVTQGSTALGALMVVIDGTEILCACNGAGSKMKVSWITFTESFAMVAMAAHGLLNENEKKASSARPKQAGWTTGKSRSY